MPTVQGASRGASGQAQRVTEWPQSFGGWFSPACSLSSRPASRPVTLKRAEIMRRILAGNVDLFFRCLDLASSEADE